MAQGREPIRLDTLDPQSLNNIKERIQRDLEQFATSANMLVMSANKFEQSRQAISSLAQSQEGQPLLLPLTQSLYVNGTIASTEKVMVDVGTGYYVEMTVEEGQDYCKRKVAKLQENLQALQQIMREKQNQMVQVSQVLSEKVAAAQQAQA
mmetsp:Transcript_40295/g.89487  ORF Transcript_40295/g.89487 Transcript_40295/m.89487 type:complete len:151 (+) Transcript_40295:125-577(+)|eukprot:CAMPEP_0202901896 /NCGR_PEP_ID=MMETSP1392-20130828/15259_1 /ASSEMBLY_ACC=CAM_ASM_000868 /TAXON_ID=225041 /ORGANISM="Chlamydomonas chlamydogama, Strain SAG 11-48b" /LENGTH=150 /DNA_ID=CAMNT_0049588549 /DNA_START=99 /DNA_END=551 /DNA_ORIENTATION=+